MISKQEVKKISFLARLKLKEGEIKKFQKELSLILDYIEKLKEVDVKNARPTSHPNFLQNVFREDEERFVSEKKEHQEIVKKIRGLFPKKEEGYLKVPKVI